jgi:hypothetical protein
VVVLPVDAAVAAGREVLDAEPLSGALVADVVPVLVVDFVSLTVVVRVSDGVSADADCVAKTLRITNHAQKDRAIASSFNCLTRGQTPASRCFPQPRANRVHVQSSCRSVRPDYPLSAPAVMPWMM